MKKLQLPTQSAFRAFQHRSIRAMLTPFLPVLFLLVFLNVSVGQQECPQPDPNCQVVDRVAVLNVAQFWGGIISCEVEFSYKERICDNVVEVFDMDSNPKNWAFTDKACIDSYNNHVKSVASRGTTAINDFILRQDILLSEAALSESLAFFGVQTPFPICPTNTVTGRSYFKNCTVSCMRWVEKVTNPEKPVSVFVLDITKIPCGRTCCTSTQAFCRDGVTKQIMPSGPKTFTSDNISGCDKNTPIKGCEAKWGYFGKSSCIIACDFVPKGLANGGSTKDDDISSIDVNAKSIKATITNNATTDNVVVSFLNDFVGKISLFDISGRQVFNAEVNTDNGGFFYIETDNFTAGVYLLSLQGNNNNIITEKILLK